MVRTTLYQSRLGNRGMSFISNFLEVFENLLIFSMQTTCTNWVFLRSLCFLILKSKIIWQIFDTEDMSLARMTGNSSFYVLDDTVMSVKLQWESQDDLTADFMSKYTLDAFTFRHH